MRIALIAPLVSTIAEPFTGGTQAFLADLAQGLTQRGHSVTLFARAGSAIPGVRIEPIVVPDEVQPSVLWNPEQSRPTDHAFFAQANLFLELFLHLQQRRSEFDLIHAHAYDWPAFSSSALLHPLPILHTIHLAALSSEINEALRVLDRQGHPLTLITVSHSCANTYRNYTHIDHIIYNGLDVDLIPFFAHTQPDAPLLYAGRITPEKGVEDALEIAALANKTLLLAGGIYDQHYYHERIAPLLQQPDRRATYLGQLTRQDLWQVMGQASGLLFPITWDEPFGLIVAESMAVGTPVIAYRRGAMEELILHAETGFLVEPGKREQAAAYVAHLPNLSRTRCRTHVTQHFSLAHMLDAYELAYTAAIHSN